jgi:uncharacterized protein involved in exopolysaccharide biosynthesis
MNEGAEHQVEIMERGENRVQTDGEESSIDFVALLNTLYSGRWIVVIATVVAFAIATTIAFRIPPQFTSTGSFIPPTGSSSTAALMGQMGQLSGLGAGGLLGGAKSQGDLYIGILKSQSVESEVVKRLGLKSVYKVSKDSQAESILAAQSKFIVGTKDSIVTISVTDKSPARARDLVTTYFDVLRETLGRLALSESSQRALFFGQQLAREKDALADAEVDLKKTEEQSGLIAPAGQTAAELGMIAQTRTQISTRQVALSALRQSATPQNPELIKIQSEIGDLQGQLARLQSGTGKKGSGAIPTSKVPELELDNVRKTREVKYHEALFDMLAKQYESARMDESHDPPLLQVLDPASFPDAKSSPRRSLIMLEGLIFGCLAGSSWVLLRQPLHRVLAWHALRNATGK